LICAAQQFPERRPLVMAFWADFLWIWLKNRPHLAFSRRDAAE
jgi:hypothetical protein